jgi:hypothetical protein
LTKATSRCPDSIAPQQAFVLEDGQLEVDARVALAERAQDLRQRGEGQVVGHAEPEPSGDGRTAEVRLRLLVRRKDLHRVPRQSLAVRGEHHRPGVPDEELASDRLLEPAHVLAHGRLPKA